MMYDSCILEWNQYLPENDNMTLSLIYVSIVSLIPHLACLHLNTGLCSKYKGPLSKQSDCMDNHKTVEALRVSRYIHNWTLISYMVNVQCYMNATWILRYLTHLVKWKWYFAMIIQRRFCKPFSDPIMTLFTIICIPCHKYIRQDRWTQR